jgi:hypothetical protein
MQPHQNQESPQLSRAQEIFRNASREYQDLIKAILVDERDVMHLQRRDDIHRRIYDHIRRVIK